MPVVDIEEYFRIFIEGVKEYAIFALDPEGHVVTWNTGAERIKGYSRGEIIGRYFGCFYTAEDQASGKPAWVLQQALRDGTYSEEGQRVRKDGTHFWAHVVVTAIRDDAGTLKGFTKVTRDITERRRAKRLESERDAVRERERARQRFIQIAAHELRNPMQGMTGLVELIRYHFDDGEMLEDQDLLLRMLEHEVDHLSLLLTEVLEAYRTDDPSFLISTSPTRLNQVLIESIAPIQETHRARQFHLDLPASPVMVMGDAARLESVFRNLVINAVKYSDPNTHITVRLRCEHDRALVEVKDQGLGIPYADQERVFEGFYRGSNLGGRDPGGLGLGLYLARQIVDRHQGRLWIESTEGVGTTVYVSLPTLVEGQ